MSVWKAPDVSSSGSIDIGRAPMLTDKDSIRPDLNTRDHYVSKQNHVVRPHTPFSCQPPFETGSPELGQQWLPANTPGPASNGKIASFP